MACFKGGLYPEVGVSEAPNDDEVWLGHIGYLTSTRETLGDTLGVFVSVLLDGETK